MVRYAEWRETVDPERPFERFDPAAQLAIALLGAAVGSVFCIVGSIPGFALASRAAERRLLLRRVARMRDIPARHLQVACRLLLENGSTVYGQDEGLVSFVEGAVLFEGRRTSFCVPRAFTTLEHHSPAGFSFRFTTPFGPSRAIVTTLEEDTMKAAMAKWLRESQPNLGHTVFPPLTPERAAWKKVIGLERFSWLVGILGILAGTASISLADAGSGLIVIVASLALAGAAWTAARSRKRCLIGLQSAALSAEPANQLAAMREPSG